MFLIQDYYHRYLGWPDILTFRDEQFFFAEIKSSNDKLRGDQKDWIRNNALYLKLPFKVYKIHKKAHFNSIEEAQSANKGIVAPSEARIVGIPAKAG